MARIEWDNGLQLIITREHKSLRHYRCLRCGSTRVNEYIMETNFGHRDKIRCLKCKKVYIFSPGDSFDNHVAHFEEIPASEVEHIERKKKSKRVESDNQLAPMEFTDIWAAMEFCKWNRCALCQSELKVTRIIEPHKDITKVHCHIECPEHGLCIKGGTASVKTVNTINMDTTIREVMDRVEESLPINKPANKILEYLGF
ncbi:MAG: hypothetical protein WC998_01610 [Candidatus Paceibacterota bacterium]